MDKEIIYTGKSELIVIEQGQYKDVKYAILNRGHFPVAYVENILRVDDYTDDILRNIDVHCGFTYCGPAYWDKKENSSFVGWDYGHICDYTVFCDYVWNEGKKWTYEEILKEVFCVIDQLLEKRDENLDR